MDAIVKQFQNVGAWITRSDDDRVDRLNSIYTVLLLVVFTGVVVGHVWWGSPIVCWGPKHFTGSHLKYSNNYCWVKPMYYLPFSDEIPKSHEEEKKDYIFYYPWIPFILLGQSLFFYLPSAIWHSLNQQAGVDADDILSGAAAFNDMDKIKENPLLKQWTANHIDKFLGKKRKSSKGESKHHKLAKRKT